MNINFVGANKANYGGARDTKNIKYIVIHYTANDGDTAENNGKYFANNVVGASAHYFVDGNSITQSVPDNYVAWSVGGNRYSNYQQTGGAKFYGKCTNNNSISVELCDEVRNGVYDFSENTIKNVVELVKMLMFKYNIPIENVIRHFDITGKNCPKPFVDNPTAWAEFKERLVEEEVVTETDIRVNGIIKTVQTINKDGYNYIKLRDLADNILSVGYDSANNLPTVAVNPSALTKRLDIKINDVIKNVEAINIDGENLVKLRDLADKKISVEYDTQSKLPVVKVK